MGHDGSRGRTSTPGDRSGTGATFGRRDAYELTKQVGRARGAIARVQNTVGQLSLRNITNSTLRNWLRRDIKPVVKAMEAANYEHKMLPPKLEDEEA